MGKVGKLTRNGEFCSYSVQNLGKKKLNPIETNVGALRARAHAVTLSQLPLLFYFTHWSR